MLSSLSPTTDQYIPVAQSVSLHQSVCQSHAALVPALEQDPKVGHLPFSFWEP